MLKVIPKNTEKNVFEVKCHSTLDDNSDENMLWLVIKGSRYNGKKEVSINAPINRIII